MNTFLHGILYFFGLAANPLSDDSAASDLDNLRADWQRIGQDIRSAMNHYAAE